MKTFVFITFALAVLIQLSFQQSTSGTVPPTIPREVITAMASKTERYHHSFFHQLRIYYTTIGPKQQKALGDLAWAPPRVAAFYVDGTEFDPNGITGEDFLFMHHRMIANVNKIAKDAGSLWKVDGWTHCPYPGDPSSPVPHAYEVPGNPDKTALIAEFKSDAFFWNVIKPEEDEVDNEDNLKSWTLGELGARLENQLHSYFHLRFSSMNNVGYRVQDPNPTAKVDDKWFDPEYDWLGDFFSAHVSPTFWKIHGWVENKIEKWRQANGYSRIYWIGTWEGGPLDQIVLNKLFEAAKIKEDSESSDSSDSSSDSSDSSSDSSSSSLDEEIDEKLMEAMLKLAKKSKHH